MAVGNTRAARGKFVPPKLQITSMMDMFTIIVFFLLFSFGDRADEIDLDKSIDLPRSTSLRNYDNAIKIFLSDKQLKIEDKVVATVRGGRIASNSDDNLEQSAVYQHLIKFKDEMLSSDNALIAETTASNENNQNEPAKALPQILFFCDKSISFKTINGVMKAAAMAGFSNIQLAVMQAS